MKQHKSSCKDPSNHSFGDGATTSRQQFACLPTTSDLPTETEEKLAKERTMVVFSVKAEEGGAYGPFDTDRTMTYNTVITNIGNAYNVSTGVFTAPVAGVYYFTFFYHAGGEHVSKLILHKNKEPVVMTSDHNGKVTRCNSETADNGGNAVFLKLEKGDKVSVQLPAGAHVWASEGHTTFSGFLVNSC
ncbi:complement C1q tumor necrosis factor-related protein 3-like [Seriola dumerili]|uniref:Complement C1q tumor necrosis factor-related protein 3-like n=1 Tax=Seriola dumerili TaxID=41447 RepID=A0A3B4UKW9_SERDU|nr:complement C1q tumor necrosis factor-related protein 3-like [Seriola dumerili]XP_022616990.1 complement C1q tumor necrosis factor-related protein 3-like [Seriola dumerili]XP_022616991.1 complement C1q tumor necrosis factor-related protein 3-like [Seriola dumerili]